MTGAKYRFSVEACVKFSPRTPWVQYTFLQFHDMVSLRVGWLSKALPVAAATAGRLSPGVSGMAHGNAGPGQRVPSLRRLVMAEAWEHG